MLSEPTGDIHQDQKTIEKYTNLTGDHLQAFCASVEFVDSEGDYNVQREELRLELSSILAGTVDDPQIANIVALVRAKVMPDSDGQIVREEVLMRFGVTSDRELFPAPPEFGDLGDVIKREQHELLVNSIFKESTPLIIHAGGGVGKSVVGRQLAKSLPVGSLGIVYDCFGGGKYRNRSETRHRHRDGLVQIANELATYGLCSPLIAGSALEDQIMRQFLSRLQTAVLTLRKTYTKAILIIFIDAADNAEMAAQEFSQSCFVHELLRETMPEGCRLVMLCRTERIHLLQPTHLVRQIQLDSFSQQETFTLLKQHDPTVTQDDALEFHRLTSGNPRVQANALDIGSKDIALILTELGPAGTTVKDQIAAQLNSAVETLKDQFPIDYQSSIDAICIGLAALPPFIPLKVLAAAANVSQDAVKSFVADLGRPLWLSDMSVQFRDEPTETWFREQFSATAEQIAKYVVRLEPLAQTYSYVAETLPSLLLQAEKYEDLVELALSDELLPNNPIDKRNVRIYRLQFAFKAALNLRRFANAMKLALRAGEEVAGDKRQLEILAQNTDLIAPLQSPQRVQELAFRQLLRGEWDGSQNVYSAALLSSVDDFKGEARGYLRAAENWLHLYIQERDKNKDAHHQDLLQIDHLVELAFAHYNLFGVEGVVGFIVRWRPPHVVYYIASLFIRKLVDAGHFDVIDQISQSGSRNQYLMIAVAYELGKVGRFPSSDSLHDCLSLLTTKRSRIKKPRYYSYDDTIPLALVSFAEACAARGLSRRQILRVLKHYFPERASKSVSGPYQEKERSCYLRAVALKSALSDHLELNWEDLLPKELEKNKQMPQHDPKVRDFKEVVGGMLPWYLLRARLLTDGIGNVFEAIDVAKQQSAKARESISRDSDALPHEISHVLVGILAIYPSKDAVQMRRFFSDFLQEGKQVRIQDRLQAVRVASRSESLAEIRRDLEQVACDAITLATNERPEIKAEWFIELARAVFPVDPGDAAVYFDLAIEAVSKFGDEIAERWEAVASIANRVAEGEHVSPEMAYRYIRCAELIGDNVDREKYFARNNALKIAVRLLPSAAFAAFSRWRDRDVGWFYHQLPALAFEVVNSEVLSPHVAWSLSAFFDDERLAEFASLCLTNEPSETIKQSILDTAIRDLRLNEAGKSSWELLDQAVQQESAVDGSELEPILSFYVNEPEIESNGDYYPSGGYARQPEDHEAVDWAGLLGGLDLSTASGVNEALRCYDELSDKFHNRENFWRELYHQVDAKGVVNFLQALVEAERSDRYDIRQAISNMPAGWRNKISVKRYWGAFLESYARRFAGELTNRFALRYDLQDLGIEVEEMTFVRNGIIDGLAKHSELVDAGTFFGFAEIGAPLIVPEEAKELLDFGLTRFELHIEDNYADGAWADWLIPPNDITVAFAGFVWAALGSPRSEIRWRAAHCVRRLALTGCASEIDALVKWMERDEVGAFGSNKFPFYNLHARQYFLIALARVSLDYPHLLKPHHAIFVEHALRKIDQVLIQRFSAEIALNIEQAFPNTYPSDVLVQFHNIGVSQFPARQRENFYQTDFNSPWHEKGEVNSELKFYLGYDIARYWLEPLGRMFGIPRKQVEELAIQIIVNEWTVDNDGSYYADPRVNIWRSGYNERETWHDHGSYPRSDNFSFYLSYHSMFVVASRLLQQMPVVQGDEWDNDRWENWLRPHLLTRSDGNWLSDCRDPAPLLRRAWFYQKKSKDWRWEIKPLDFLDGLLFEQSGETWLNVFGWWEDGDSYHEENFRISTALVATTASQALLNALTTCLPNDFWLPSYEDEQAEFGVYPFELRGWIWHEDSYKGLDEFDPHAGTSPYFPARISDVVVAKLQLTSDFYQRNWYLPNTKQPVITCQLWGTNKTRQDEDPLRKGQQLSASLTFLKQVCAVFDCEVIFDVEIARRFRQRSHQSSREGNEYAPPYHKVYLFSADGTLRDAKTHFQLR
ncbi:MAG: hypothetical protein KC423_07400 [Anaerolineales bacterium]|nr:hypothetical protein [Anaerolineales bacterium]